MRRRSRSTVAAMRNRDHKIEPFASLLGVASDLYVADRAGVTAQEVRAFRERTQGAAPGPTSAAAVPATPDVVPPEPVAPPAPVPEAENGASGEERAPRREVVRDNAPKAKATPPKAKAKRAKAEPVKLIAAPVEVPVVDDLPPEPEGKPEPTVTAAPAAAAKKPAAAKEPSPATKKPAAVKAAEAANKPVADAKKPVAAAKKPAAPKKPAAAAAPAAAPAAVAAPAPPPLPKPAPASAGPDASPAKPAPKASKPRGARAWWVTFDGGQERVVLASDAASACALAQRTGPIASVRRMAEPVLGEAG